MYNIFEKLYFKVHCEIIAGKRTGSFLYHSSAQTILFISGLLIISFALVKLRDILIWLSNLHWLSGLIVAAGVIAGLIYLIHCIKNTALTQHSFGLYPKIGLALNLVFAVLAAMTSMAMISDVLYRQQIVCYASNAPITVANFLDFYGWHFIDSIPFLKVWEIFEVKPRISSQDFGARALVQLFRVSIVASAIQVFQKKKAAFPQLLADAQDYRERKAYIRAEYMLRAANKHAEQSGNKMDQVDAHLEEFYLYVELAGFCSVQAPVTSEKARQKIEKHSMVINKHIKAAKKSLAEVKQLIDDISRERDLEIRKKLIEKSEIILKSLG